MPAVVVSIVLAGAVVAALVIGVRRRGAAEPAPAWLGWAVLAAGVAGVLALLAPLVQSWASPADQAAAGIRWVLPASITLGLVSLAAGLYAVTAGARSWRTWTGLACGALVTAFWLVFAAGELLYPH